MLTTLTNIFILQKYRKNIAELARQRIAQFSEFFYSNSIPDAARTQQKWLLRFQQ